MPNKQSKPEHKKPWLTLNEAADLMGVHYTTIRRWANQGLIVYTRTPGGHRRLSRESLLKLHQSQLPVVSTVDMKTRAADTLREKILVLGQHTGWAKNLDEIERMRYRYSGKMLMGLLMQYNNSIENGEVYLAEARRLAIEHGKKLKENGLNILEAIQTFLAIRQQILEMIFTTSLSLHNNDADGQRLYKRTYHFLDTFMLSIIEVYNPPH